MGRNIMKKLVFLLGFLLPLSAMAAADAVWWLTVKGVPAVAARPNILAMVREHAQYCIDQGHRDKLQALGIITYPPEWDAFQKELAGMNRQRRHAFLSAPPAGHAVLHDFHPNAARPLHEEFRDYLDAKFRGDETLRSSTETERPKFDAIIRDVHQESQILQYQRDGLVGYALTDDQKYHVAEAMVLEGAHMSIQEAVARVLPPLMVRDVDQTLEVAQYMSIPRLLPHDQAVRETKTRIYTAETDNILRGRVPAAQRDAMIAEMVATDATGQEALEHALRGDHGDLALAIAARMVVNPAETLDQALQEVRVEGMRARYARQLEGIAWADAFFAHVVGGGDADAFISDRLAEDLRADPAAALARFNTGAPYATIIKDARIERAMGNVRALGGRLTEPEQKALATIMVERGVDTRGALTEYLESKGYNRALSNDVQGNLRGRSLDEAIAFVTVGGIRRVFPNLTDREATLVARHGIADPRASLRTYLGTIRVGKEDALMRLIQGGNTLTQALKKQDAWDAEYATLEGLALPNFPAGSPRLAMITNGAFEWSDALPGISRDEARLRALTDWISGTTDLSIGGRDDPFKRRQIATHIARRMLESKQTNEACHGEFMARMAGARTALADFATNNYQGGVTAAKQRNQKLFSPLTASGAWSLRAVGAGWDQGDPHYDWPIIDDLAYQLALHQLPFHPDPTDLHWDTNRNSLTRAMAGVLEHKNMDMLRYADAYRMDDGLPYVGRVKNKQLRASFAIETKSIAERMFLGIEGEFNFGTSYEDAQREVMRDLRAQGGTYWGVPMLQGDGGSYLDDATTGTLFAGLFPRGIGALNPEQTALLEDMIFLRFIPAGGIDPREIRRYRKLAKLALGGGFDKETAEAALVSLVEPANARFGGYGVAEEDLPGLAEEAVFGGDNLQGLSHRALLEDYYYQSPEFRDYEGVLTQEYKKSLDYMVQYGMTKEKALALHALAQASVLHSINLPEHVMHEVIKRYDLPDGFSYRQAGHVKGFLQAPLMEYLRRQGVRDPDARSILRKVFDEGQMFMDAQIQVLSEQARDLLRAQLTPYVREVYNDEIGVMAGRILVRHHLQETGHPKMLEAGDFGDGTAKGKIYQDAQSIIINEGRIKECMVDSSFGYDDTRDIDYEPLCMKLLQDVHDLGAVDAAAVRSAHLSLWLQPIFETDSGLRALHATPEKIKRFSEEAAKDWDVFRGTPPEMWPALYKKVNKVLPHAVVDYERVYAERVGLATHQRRASIEAAVAALPAVKNYMGFGGAPVIGGNHHPGVRRYFDAMMRLIGLQEAQLPINGWTVNWQAFKVDPYAPIQEGGEVTTDVLRASFAATPAVLKVGGQLALVLDRLVTPGFDPLVKGSFNRVLCKLTELHPVNHESEKVTLALRICDDISVQACSNRYLGAVNAMETLLLGTSLASFESKISYALRTWRLELIDRAIASMDPQVSEVTQMEQKNFLKITGNLPLGLDFTTNHMEHLPCLRVNLLAGEVIPFYCHHNPRGPYSESWRFETMWGGILRKITVDSMIAQVQSVIEPSNAKGGSLISGLQFRDWATQSSMLFEYVAARGAEALWDPGTHLVKSEVVKTVLYGLGYLDFDPARAGHGGAGAGIVHGAGHGGPAPIGDAVGFPECWPKMRRLVPIGAGVGWVGTDDPTDPLDPLYRR